MFGIGKLNKAQIDALEVITANVMIADTDLNIRYMNQSVKELLKDAESDLKKELPRFDFAKLIGSNIDIFHKNPSHQRNMLAKLQKPHRATIYVGNRAFDLTVAPLKEGSRTVGFVVEWANAHERLLNLDYRNQMTAISRVQAIIEFTPEGEVVNANKNFLDLLGYTLDEIKGRHHSIFVDPAYRSTEAYQEFWRQLRSGNFQAAEFTRYGKSGNKVVINASYNPILDEKGNVTKIVKFSTDVTERVRAVDTIGHALSELADGNLAQQLRDPFAPDFEPLRVNFNEALSKLDGTLGAVSVATSRIDGGTREISHGAEDLSRRTEQQAASLEETAAALDEITVNVNNASKRADEARRATDMANTSAAHSGEIVSQAVAAMARIEESSGRISSIISVIDEIAFQTNLLALNAGVEAARAGEAGKGFAVVAQEVRELAQRSANAAKEIKGLIRHSSEEVHSGVQLVSETGEALKTIQTNIAVVNDHMHAIASAAREQATGLSEVNSAVNQMDQVTQQNAGMVEETTAASAALAMETDTLRQLIARFQVSASAQQGGAYNAPAAHATNAAPKRATAAPRSHGNAALKTDTWTEF